MNVDMTPEGMAETLEEEFQGAVEFVRTGTFRATQDQQLSFYGYYKQATVGPCNTEEPGFFDFTGKTKWKAWKDLGEMSASDAKSHYVGLVDEILVSSAAGGPPPRKENWVPQSQPIRDDEESLEDTDKTIIDWTVEHELEKVKEILEEDPTACNFRDATGLTALHFAADVGDERIAKLLLSSGAAVDAQDDEGQSALHLAAMVEYEGILAILINAGANLDLKDNEGESPKDLLDAALLEKLNKGN
eukprot:TRINITY_DN3798_c0_g1_i1.p1 TRINITY_DN3798_c0_g1~~TRINITY_DN3798_c0_g1_i1.p1  ORF type:complete len:277 (-),score=69.32 TRINITY_DN3798_c0_g1_i1:271-1008(-)